MKPTPHVGHRRAHLRFEVVGGLTAAVSATEALRIVDLGTSGALVESALPLAPNSEHRMQLVLDGHVSEVVVKVRRIERGGAGYRVGVEFLALSDEAGDVITEMVLAGRAADRPEAANDRAGADRP